MLRTFLTFTGLVATCVACWSEEPAPQQPNRQFTISAAPSDVVLLVTYRGGQSGLTHHYTLHGDGRLEIREQDQRGQ